MPLEGIDEEGLPHNPDLEVAQLKFLLTLEDSEGIDRDEIWQKLLEVVKEKCELASCPCIHVYFTVGVAYSFCHNSYGTLLFGTLS